MIEVKLLHYTFQFRRMTWREEFALKFGKEDPRKVTLAASLDNVSGLKIDKIEDALRIFKTIPEAVLQRAYIIYRYKLPKTRIFSTRELYKAPEPVKHQVRVQEIEEKQEEAVDVLHRQMEATFGRKDLQEQRELEAEILKKSDKRGAVKGATPNIPTNAVAGEQQTQGPTHRQRGIRPKGTSDA
jgi:hypothetical protein